MIRFGKSTSALLKHKKDTVSQNTNLLNERIRIGEIYKKQPERTLCKCCSSKLKGKEFVKQTIKYIICEYCGHLNGIYEDSDAFCAAVYTDNSGKAYAKNYSSDDAKKYNLRVKDIYIPKANFLKKALEEKEKSPEELIFADFGAGSGYFVQAMRKIGFSKSLGYEVSEAQVNLANSMIGKKVVIKHELDETINLATQIKVDVVTMIGVLEHVQEPREILKAFKKNKSIKYLYILVLLFSPSIMIEAVFQNVYPRVLGGGHTHLFTENSIDWLCNEFQMKRISEWWFGTDIMDIYRSVMVELESNKKTASLSNYWKEMIVQSMDDAQLALDRKKMCSEVHMLLEF